MVSSYGDLLRIQEIVKRSDGIQTEAYINESGNLEVFIHNDEYKFPNGESEY
jgi:hypothetical protein